ncbi:arylesterase [Halomonas cupida]|uniref:arylesterase n=1 Tax=Halomonas cupida TaxID=44933 RepID=UPI003A94A0FF
MTNAIPEVGRWQHGPQKCRRWLLSVITLFAALWLSIGTAHSQTQAQSPILLVVGDSLSAAYGIPQEAGWVTLLDQRLDGRAQVINASISGETSSGGASRLAGLLEQHQPDIVVLELGGNDGLRGLPPQQMQANLNRMIEQSRSSGADVLLVGIDIPPNYGQAYREAFGQVFRSLADEHQLPLLPFLLEGIALKPELMQEDGIHPTADAQPLMLDNVWAELAPLLREQGVQLATEASQAKASQAEPSVSQTEPSASQTEPSS